MRPRRAAVPEPEPSSAEQNRRLAIARLVWIGFDERHDVVHLLAQVDEVLAGRGCLLSRVEREAVEAAAKRIAEEP